MAQPSERARQPIRFLVVGVANTALDFAILLGLTALGMPVVLANTISTGVALVFSFFANRTFTFRAAGSGVGRQAAAFLVTTLIGLWAIQPLVILGVQALLRDWPTATIALVAAKLVATVASMTWNYLTYSRFVFRADRGPLDSGEANDAREGE